MEWEPKKEEVSLDEQVALSKKLSDAVDAANDFIRWFGGFDDFADVHQHVGGNREKFDKLSNVRDVARDELDQKVKDKKALVDYLQSIGEKN